MHSRPFSAFGTSIRSVAAAPPVRFTAGPAIPEVQQRELTAAEREDLLKQELAKVNKAVQLSVEMVDTTVATAAGLRGVKPSNTMMCLGPEIWRAESEVHVYYSSASKQGLACSSESPKTTW